MPVNVSFYMKCIKAECIFLMAAETATSNALAECVCARRVRGKPTLNGIA